MHLLHDKEVIRGGCCYNSVEARENKLVSVVWSWSVSLTRSL